MKVALWCLFFNLIWLIANKAPLFRAMQRDGSGYDNHLPRQQQSRLTGLGARALAAHQNGFEAFGMFVAALFIAVQAGTDPIWLNRLALVHVVARVIYTVLYWLDWASLRTLMWSIGYLSLLAMALLGLL